MLAGLLAADSWPLRGRLVAACPPPPPMASTWPPHQSQSCGAPPQIDNARVQYGDQVESLQTELVRVQDHERELKRSQTTLAHLLEEAAPRAELIAAQTLADSARAELRASAGGRIRAVIGLMQAQRKIVRLEEEIADLRLTVSAKQKSHAEREQEGAFSRFTPNDP